jgi:hypothetical protein
MKKHAAILAGPLLGILYGAFARLSVDGQGPLFLPVTYGFIFFVPLAMGYLSVRGFARPRWWQTTFVPWITWILAVALACVVGWEGAICVVMAAPVGLVLASIGGWCAILVRRWFPKGAAVVLVLPFVLMPLESEWQPPARVRSVESTIDIAAPRARVWEQIREVPPIRPDEHGTTLFNRIGFPRPIEARLYGEGVGAVRHATFEGGVLFVERITAWEEGRRLAFSIRADTTNIPATTLDEHVTIGGRYFDVLDGEYRLEDLPSGGTRVYLTSHHRLTTTMEPYAGLWTDAIMQSIQARILEVIRHRCEESGA